MRVTTALSLALCSLLASTGATASVTVDLVFRGSGTNTTTLSHHTAATAVPVLDVLVTTGIGTELHAFSVQWDTRFGVGVSSAITWIGGRFPDNTPGPPAKVRFDHIGSRVPAVDETEGEIVNFTGAVHSGESNFLGPGTFNHGTVAWDLSGAVLGSQTVISGFLKAGFDAFADVDGQQIPENQITFKPAEIQIIPEPGTGALIGLGLAGLVAGRRLRRRA